MKYNVPADVAGGIDIGGEHFMVEDGVVDLPDDGDYSRLLSSEFVPIPPEPKFFDH